MTTDIQQARERVEGFIGGSRIRGTELAADIAAVLDALDRVTDDAHRLGMMALQSDRYVQDSEYRDATDNVLPHLDRRIERSITATDDPFTVAGIKVYTNPNIPAGEVRFVHEGKLVGISKISPPLTAPVSEGTADRESIGEAPANEHMAWCISRCGTQPCDCRAPQVKREGE